MRKVFIRPLNRRMILLFVIKKHRSLIIMTFLKGTSINYRIENATQSPPQISNFEQFPIKWSFWRNYQTKLNTCIVVKLDSFCLRGCPEAPFYWKLFKIGIRSAEDIRKDVPIFQVYGSAPALPTPPVFRVVL